MAEPTRQLINPASAPQPIGAYSLAAVASGSKLVFLAGQVAMDASGNVVGQNHAAAQTRQVFENLGLVLAGAGASFNDVVEFTTYVVGRSTVQPYIQARSEIYSKLFPDGDYPANTLLIVDGLVREELLLEVKAVAVLP
jgi:enamine deaminase RidA (YjgF/YER057c/UK114 family)